MNIFVLATCRNHELLPATLLLFDSLRVGFPDASVKVWDNGMDADASKAVSEAMLKTGCHADIRSKPTIHHKWIETLVDEENEPFVILDTDIVFWNRCDGWKFDTALAGRLIPEFSDPFSKCVSKPRLHGSFLWIDPVKVREQIGAWQSRFPATPFTPTTNLFYPQVLPMDERDLFFDTCGLLYHAIGGTAFKASQMDCYDHLNCGTISDIVAPHLKDLRLRESHFAVFENAQLARGAWKNQDNWYRKHA